VNDNLGKDITLLNDNILKNKVMYHSVAKNNNIITCLDNGNINILLILHLWEFEIKNSKAIGGTSLHVMDIVNKLRYNFNFHILAPYEDDFRLYSYWRTGEEMIKICFFHKKFNANRLFSIEYYYILNEIINTYKIDIIHIHHMLGHYFNIIDIVKENRKIKLIISLHDYYSVCPRINKINHNNEYCGNPTENECNNCISFTESFFTGGIKNIYIWRNLWSILFSYSHMIIVPSEDSKIEIANNYPYVKIDVIEHGIELSKYKSQLYLDKDVYFNVAFIGNISIIKGKSIIEKLIKYSKNNNNIIKFHLFGSIFSKKNKNCFLINHGEYNRENIYELLKKSEIKLTCIFSICPETFCFTFVESLANGIPILSFDEGVIGNKIKEYNLGWLIKRNANFIEINRLLLNIFNDKKGYEKISKAVNSYKIKTLDDMIRDYNDIYFGYKANEYAANLNERRKCFFEQNLFRYYVNHEFTNKLNQVYKSSSWQVGKKITWFPRMLKKVINNYQKFGLVFTAKVILNKIVNLKNQPS